MGYVPHPKQLEIHRAADRGVRFINVNAGTRSGKTAVAAAMAVEDLAAYPPENVPLGIIPVIAPYKELTDKLFRYVWNWVVNKRVLGCLPKLKSERERFIEMPWGMRLEGKTAESPDTLLGEGWIRAYVDENARIKPRIYEQYIERALMDNKAGAVLTTTPYGRNNHHYERYMDWTKQSEHDPDYYTTTFTSYDNPHLPPGEVARIEAKFKRQGLTEIFRQEYLAEFTALSGSVYPNFTQELNGCPWHVQNYKLDRNIPFIAGIDWGFRNPFVFLLAQATGDDRLYVYDEVYQSGLTNEECAVAATRKLSKYGLKPPDIQIVYADPSSPEAIQTFRKHGFRMYQSSSHAKRINDVNDGIAAVRSQFGREDVPGIVIHRQCTNTIREIEGLIYNDRSNDERPVKQDDHAPDALRYIVIAHQHVGPSEIRLGATRGIESVLEGYN